MTERLQIVVRCLERSAMAKTILDNYQNWLHLSDMPDNKRRLIEATITLYAQQGIAATSVSQIAQQAGLSKALFFKLFHTKDEVTMALIQPVFDHVLPSFTEDFYNNFIEQASLEDLIRFIVFNRYAFLSENREIVLIFLSEFLTNQTLRSDFLSYLVKHSDGFHQVMHVFQEKNTKLNTSISQSTLMMAIVSQLFFLFLETNLWGQPLSKEEESVRLEEMIQLVSTGITG